MRHHPYLAVVLLAAPSLTAQSFPYEKYTLPNGLVVILREDHSLPTVAINLWYRVGSKDEQPGRSGFAHLFEHLMFMGTERVPGNQFDVLMEQGGGSNNASTSEDRTNYFSSGPASLLPTLLWLDADRLEDLGRTMTQEKLDRQRDIVRNEIRQNVENTPYGRAGERVYRLMFPVGHPYHEAVYGTHQDLEAATVGDVKDFFATYYTPDNCALVVAGDFDKATIRPLVDSLFGSLPRGGAVTRRPVPDATLPGVVRQTMLDKVQLPVVKMVWHSPKAFADGDAEMALLGMVLSQGKNSRLYKRLVIDDKVATDTSAYQDSLALGSMFTVEITGVPGADLDRIEQVVDEELARVRTAGIGAEELAQRQATFELSRLSRWQNLGSVADQLNQYEFVWGEPDSFARDLDRFRKATPEGVQRVAAATLDPARRVILRVLPEQPEKAPSPRDTRPAAGGGGAFTLPAPTTFRLPNGIPVHLWSRRELPLVTAQVLFTCGPVLTEPATAGLTGLTATMLGEGAGDRSALAFAAAIQSLGGRIGIGANHESASASVTVLARNFAPAAGLLGDALQRPRLEPADWERVHRLHLDDLRQADDEPNAVAARVGMRVLFGEQSPYGWPAGGTIATVSKLQLDDVRRERARVFAPQNAAILVAGDLDEATCRQALEQALGGWQGTAAPAATAPLAAALQPVPATGLRVVVVHRQEAVQTVLRLYAPGPRYADERRLQHELLGTILGGSFTSRLNQNLREQHGFTYGARAGYAMAPATGWFSAGANVRADVTGAALKEFFVELRRIAGSERADVSDQEVVKACETIRTETVQSFGNLGGLVGNAAEQLLNGRPFPALAADLAALTKVTAADLNAIGRAAVALDRTVLVLVGDRDVIKAQLQGVDLPPAVEVDVDGRPTGR